MLEQLRSDVRTGARALGTAKNWCSHLRTFARLIDRRYLVPRTNAELGFGKRVYVPTKSKAVALGAVHLERITCPFVMASLRLQSEFGLRREEAIKIVLEQADQGDRLVLQASWCKGGRERVLPICTASQRAAVDKAKALAATTEKGSLIPTQKYVQQKWRFEYQCRKAGLSGSHGLRHEYAQWRLPGAGGICVPAGRRAEEKGHDAGDATSGLRRQARGGPRARSWPHGCGEGVFRLGKGGTNASEEDHGTGDAGDGKGA